MKAERRDPPARVADRLRRTYSVLVQSKLLILSCVERGCVRLGRASPEEVAEMAATTRRTIEEYSRQLDYWSLRCAPSEPQFWVTLYGRLLALQETLFVSLQSRVAMSPEAEALLRAELEEIEHQMDGLRERQRVWQRRLSRQPRRSGRLPLEVVR